MNYKELTAPQLVTQWKKLVNDNVMMGRDAALFKRQLLEATSTQIMLGIYQYKGQNTITIPQFLSQVARWMVYDDIEAEVELAVKVATASPPPEYWVWKDFYQEDEIPAIYIEQFKEARSNLLTWARRVLE